MTDNYYWVSSLFFLGALAVILKHERALREDANNEETEYRRLLKWVILFCLQDVFWWLCECRIIASSAMFFVASSVFHCATALVNYAWLRYVLCFLKDTINTKYLLLLGKALVAVQFGLVARNFFVPTIFHIEYGFYIVDSWRNIAFWVQSLMYAIMQFSSAYCVFANKAEGYKRYLMVFGFTLLLPVFLGGLQYVLPNDSFYSIGYTFACFGFYIFIIHKDRTKLVDMERNQEKQEAELMIKAQIAISNTDELTGLDNRRSYEKDLKNFSASDLSKDFVYIAADVNGLKKINDTKGHAAGDELIKGAAKCLLDSFGHYGKVYRTGGDEFVAVLHCSRSALESVRKDLALRLKEYKTELVEELTISFGTATVEEFPNVAIDRLAIIADERMYQSKSTFYISRGIERRVKNMAYTMLCNTYSYILRVNLTSDKYVAIRVPQDELLQGLGYSDRFSAWLQQPNIAGAVCQECAEKLQEQLSLTNIKAYFSAGNTTKTIKYQRRAEGKVKNVKLELIAAEDYEQNNQWVYLYLKEQESAD